MKSILTGLCSVLNRISLVFATRSFAVCTTTYGMLEGIQLASQEISLPCYTALYAFPGREGIIGFRIPRISSAGCCYITMIITSRKARRRRSFLLRRPHDGTSTTATRRRSGKARVCDDSVLTSSGSMHA